MKHVLVLLAVIVLMVASLPEAIAGSRTHGAPTMSAISFDVPALIAQPSLTATSVTVADAGNTQSVAAKLTRLVDGTDRTPTTDDDGHASGYAQPTRAVNWRAC